MYNREGCGIEVWLSLVERLVWDQEVAGSNPVTSTIFLYLENQMVVLMNGKLD